MYANPTPAPSPRRLLVAGGGPAGMKAATVAAARGHDVVLYERSARLGGQAVLAERLPGRAEFGGRISNLVHEMTTAGVNVVRAAPRSAVQFCVFEGLKKLAHRSGRWARGEEED